MAKRFAPSLSLSKKRKIKEKQAADIQSSNKIIEDFFKEMDHQTSGVTENKAAKANRQAMGWDVPE